MIRDRLDDLLPILRCPKTGEALQRHGDMLASSEARYPIIMGKPVLVRHIEPHHVAPPQENIVSRTTERLVLPARAAAKIGWKLQLGCGDVAPIDSTVVSVDVLPTATAEIICEAESLPFATDTFCWVDSRSVFEHVYDPVRSAAEVRRVLQPGGEFYIDTAFLQGYHGFPSHFFNMTMQCAETYLVDDFELVESVVPEASGSPWTHLINIVPRLLHGLSPDDAAQLAHVSFGDLPAYLEENSERLSAQLPQHVLRALATSVAVTARKPRNYDPSRTSGEPFVRLKRAYYAARVGVIERHFEVEYYGRLAVQKYPGVRIHFPVPVDEILDCAACRDMMDYNAWTSALEKLNGAEMTLRNQRDDHLRIYCS